jgi:hypothetical protein
MAWTPEDVGLSQIPYRGKVLKTAKVQFRPDAWDDEHFPHVMKWQPTIDDATDGT